MNQIATRNGMMRLNMPLPLDDKHENAMLAEIREREEEDVARILSDK